MIRIRTHLNAGVAALALLTATPAAADDFGGSFGPSGAGPQATQPQTDAPSNADCGNDSFGGSFALSNPLCDDGPAASAPARNEEGVSPATAEDTTRPGPIARDDCEDPLQGSFTTDCPPKTERVERTETQPATRPAAQPPASDGGDTTQVTGGGAAPSDDDDFGGLQPEAQPPRTQEPERREASEPPITRPETRPSTRPATRPERIPDGRQPRRQVAQIPERVARFETQNFGVAPPRSFYTGPMHAPTPTSIPGARLLTTQGLLQLAASGSQVLLLDVLGAQSTLPGALSVPVMARGRSLNDQTQSYVKSGLDRLTRGRTDTPVVVFCSDPQCWLSYNGALRAVAAGYRQVYWYRGGHAAWRMAGGQFVRAQY